MLEKYVVLIEIYALSIVYTIVYAAAIISYNAGAFDDFFSKHFTLYFSGLDVISIIFYALFGMLIVRFGKVPKQTKREIVIDLVLVDLPAVLSVTHYFLWGRGDIYNFMQEGPNDSLWLHLILIDNMFWKVILIAGSMMLGIELMRYKNYFKQRPAACLNLEDKAAEK